MYALDLITLYTTDKFVGSLRDFEYKNVSFNDFLSFGTLLKTRGHVYKLYKPQTTKTARKNFFADGVINVWNSLPPVVDFSSLACFKRTI